MAITANGVGSGLDINGLVKQLMSIEQRPLTLLNAKEASSQAKISAFGQVRSALDALNAATITLGRASLFSSKTATVSDTNRVTATTGLLAQNGTHSLQVLQLAEPQRIVTSPATPPNVSAGSLTLDFGQYEYDADGNATSFVSSNKPVTLDLDNVASLEDVYDAINAAKLGVSATIVDNGASRQLVLTSTATGAASAFTLTGTDGLTGFNYNAADAASNTLQELVAAQDAKLKLDGLEVARGTNTVTDLIKGVTLNLLEADPTKTVTIKIANNNSTATDAVEKFVSAYNDFAKTAASLTAYDAQNDVAGLLVGDSTMRTLQQQLRSTLGSTISGFEGAGSLSALGISFQKDGTLAFDKAKLERALNDPNIDVAGLFAGKDGATGFAGKLQGQLSSYLDRISTSGRDGLLAQRTNGIQSSIDALGRRRETVALRLESIETRYRAQFTALDSLIANMTSTSNYLTQQLAALSNLNGK